MKTIIYQSSLSIL